MITPIVRLEIKGLEETIVRAFHSDLLEYDDLVKGAVTRACSESNIKAVLDEEVAKCVDSLVKQTVKEVLWYGEGRDVLKRAIYTQVTEALKKSI